MKLTILSGHGTSPVAGGSCSGYLLEHDGFKLWMDAGNGTLGKLLQHWEFADVDAIWISHAHADHSVDLYPYFYRLLSENASPIPVLAPSGVREKLSCLVGADSMEAWGTLLDWRVLDPGQETNLGPFALSGSNAEHSSPNTVLRLEASGKSLCYSGDTGPVDSLPDAARDVDVFLCEASWVDPAQVFAPIHLLASQAGDYAQQASVDRLILTHVWASNDRDRVLEEAASKFKGKLDLAYDLTSVEI
jgi:ribonuclease BN (tRNA processing enzyme)